MNVWEELSQETVSVLGTKMADQPTLPSSLLAWLKTRYETMQWHKDKKKNDNNKTQQKTQIMLIKKSLFYSGNHFF